MLIYVIGYEVCGPNKVEPLFCRIDRSCLSKLYSNRHKNEPTGHKHFKRHSLFKIRTNRWHGEINVEQTKIRSFDKTNAVSISPTSTPDIDVFGFRRHKPSQKLRDSLSEASLRPAYRNSLRNFE